jgi:hypothetical protein
MRERCGICINTRSTMVMNGFKMIEFNSAVNVGEIEFSTSH